MKEVLENALDAGATNIDIKIQDHGLRSITVVDNGCGVKEIDFESLTAKHHTSKLDDFEDLDKVDTFGFRGEALSSLCAAATLTIITRHKDSSLGTRLKFDKNGRIETRKVEPRSIGTTAIVEDIFKDFPVRKIELQKNIKKEYAKMVTILQSYGISLCNNVRINATCIKNKSNESIMSV